jgi:hypothetical protein
MANTFVKIATVTVDSGGAATIDFTSIPGTYTDLVIKISGRTNASSPFYKLTFNSSTSGYSWRQLYGTGSGIGTQSGSSDSAIWFGDANPSTYTATTFANGKICIPNYTSSTNKSVSVDNVNENNATGAAASLTTGLWANSAVITSLSITVFSGSFVQYSTATLYGIKSS